MVGLIWGKESLMAVLRPFLEPYFQKAKSDIMRV